jgi:hypothetical protein
MQRTQTQLEAFDRDAWKDGTSAAAAQISLEPLPQAA